MEAVVMRRLREATPAEKAAQLVALNRTSQTLALARIRRTYPEASEREQELRLASLWLDGATMRRVFGWNPDRMGY